MVPWLTNIVVLLLTRSILIYFYFWRNVRKCTCEDKADLHPITLHTSHFLPPPPYVTQTNQLTPPPPHLNISSHKNIRRLQEAKRIIHDISGHILQYHLLTPHLTLLSSLTSFPYSILLIHIFFVLILFSYFLSSLLRPLSLSLLISFFLIHIFCSYSYFWFFIFILRASSFICMATFFFCRKNGMKG